jgi:hypothetical protein
MKLIKKLIIGQRVSNRSKKEAATRPVKFDQIKKISLIAENEAEASEASRSIKEAWSHPVEVNFIYREENPALECYHYKDFNLLGKPNEKIQQFLSLPSDLILVTQSEMDPLAARLVQLLPPVYRTGFYNESHKKHLDLMLEKEEIPLKENISNLIKYLKLIN